MYMYMYMYVVCCMLCPLLQDPDNDTLPRFPVTVKISSQCIKIADSMANVSYYIYMYIYIYYIHVYMYMYR